MEGSSWHCTEGRDQEDPQEKEIQKSKTVVWGGLTNSWEKKRSQRQRRKGNIYWSVYRVTRISRRDLKKSPLKWTMQRSRGKQQNGKD